jgi:exosortase/archaeosortase family protein
VVRRLNIRVVISLTIFVGVVLLGFRDEVLGPVLVPLRILTARTVLGLIHLTGMAAVRGASVIYHPGGFAYEISRGCMGLVPTALLIVSTLAYPGQLWRKMQALAVGIPLLLGLNLIRLLHLFYLGVYRAEFFHLAHQVLWQAAIVLAVFALWLAATYWIEPETRARSAGRVLPMPTGLQGAGGLSRAPGAESRFSQDVSGRPR